MAGQPARGQPATRMSHLEGSHPNPTTHPALRTLHPAPEYCPVSTARWARREARRTVREARHPVPSARCSVPGGQNLGDFRDATRHNATQRTAMRCDGKRGGTKRDEAGRDGTRRDEGRAWEHEDRATKPLLFSRLPGESPTTRPVAAGAERERRKGAKGEKGKKGKRKRKKEKSEKSANGSTRDRTAITRV